MHLTQYLQYTFKVNLLQAYTVEGKSANNLSSITFWKKFPKPHIFAAVQSKIMFGFQCDFIMYISTAIVSIILKVFIMTAKIGYLPILCAFKFNAYWGGIVFSYDCVEVATVDNSNCVLHNALVAVIAVEEYELSKKVVSRL